MHNNATKMMVHVVDMDTEQVNLGLTEKLATRVTSIDPDSIDNPEDYHMTL
jgi:hypothetical protein